LALCTKSGRIVEIHFRFNGAGAASGRFARCSRAEVAAELAMADNTVRAHIRHAFEKTGIERLSDFVRLLMQGRAFT
jgi:hypothetical protein